MWNHQSGQLGEENLLELAGCCMVWRSPENLNGDKVRRNYVKSAQGQQSKRSLWKSEALEFIRANSHKSIGVGEHVNIF